MNKMKIVFFLMLGVCLFLMSSCSDQEDEPTPTPDEEVPVIPDEELPGEASNVIHVAKAGTLSGLVDAQMQDTATCLTITGTMNEYDFLFLREIKNLKRLDLSGLSNTTMPNSTFKQMPLEALVLPSGLTAIPNEMCRDCKKLKEVFPLPEHLVTIGEHAFYDCRNLTGELKLPEDVTHLGNHAFGCCQELTGDLVVPAKVVSLGDYGCTFAGCDKINKVYFKPTVPPASGNDPLPNTNYLGVPVGSKEAYRKKWPNILVIEEVDFDKLDDTEEDLPGEELPGEASNVIHVAKAGTLSGLVDAQMQDTATCLTITGTMNEYDFLFLREIKNLKRLDLSGLSNTTMPNSTFKQMPLEALVLPSGLTAIPNEMCRDCKKLKEVFPLPEHLVTIGEHAFYDCRNLTGELKLPEDVTHLGNHAFGCCQELTGDLVVPAKVVSLGDYGCTFAGCDKINKVYFKPTVPPASGYDPLPNTNYLGVPVGCKKIYQKKWPNILVIEEVDFEKLGL